MNEITKRIIFASTLSALIAGGAGLLIGKWIYTPVKSWTAGRDRSSADELIVESRTKERAKLYRMFIPEDQEEEFVSGETASKILNEVWRKDYEKRNGKKPDFNHYNMYTQWEYWR